MAERRGLLGLGGVGPEVTVQPGFWVNFTHFLVTRQEQATTLSYYLIQLSPP